VDPQIFIPEPQTPAELAALKAENSRNHRLRQTGRNLALSLAASLGIVVALVFLVVRPENNLVPPVDYLSTANEAQQSIDETIAVPELPAGWSVNKATFTAENADGVTVWNLGYITADKQFIGFYQGIGADEAWTARQLSTVTPTGSVTIDGTTWVEYDHRDNDDIGNYEYALSTAYAEGQLVLHGTADDDEFAELAAAALDSVKETP
jgi:hypothetical protein